MVARRHRFAGFPALGLVASQTSIFGSGPVIKGAVRETFYAAQ